MMRVLFLFIVFLLTVNFSSKKDNAGNSLSEHPYTPVVHIGNITSVSIQENDSIYTYSDTLTSYAGYIYDSIIQRRIKNKSTFNELGSEKKTYLNKLTTNVTEAVFIYHKTKSYDKIPFLGTIDSIARTHPERYSSYFLNYGNLITKKQHRRNVAEKTLTVSVIVLGAAFLTAAAIFTDYNDFSYLDFNGASQSSSTEDDPFDYENELRFIGMKNNFMIYDKQTRKVCYIKSKLYKSNKVDDDPFDPKKVAEQLNYFFK